MIERINKPFTNNLYIVVLLHLAGWLFFFFLPFLAGLPLDNTPLVIKFAAQTAILAIFYYTNIFFLIPRFLVREKIGIYIMYVLLCIILIFFYYQAIEQWYETVPRTIEAQMTRPGTSKFRGAKKIYGPIFSAIFIFALSTSIHITNKWFKNEKQKKEMENEKLISELSFLKSQVSPHFLFNTLNNIYSLSLSNSEHTSDAIMKLSHLLRYMLYESQDKLVSIKKEVDYLQHYIDLQKIRLTKEVAIVFKTRGNFESKMIEPMLLIPFVENAFKHGINYSEKSFVSIYISVDEDKLSLKVENSLFPKNTEKKENSGIGLSNTKKRLELLYPGRHILAIRQEEKKYTVELTMNLHL